MMELRKAKVKATGEEVLVRESETKEGVYDTADHLQFYKESELLFADSPYVGGDAPVDQHKKWSDIDPADYLSRALEMQNHNFWRDQRVEITKILLQRVEPGSTATTKDVVTMADDIIQQLKTFKD